ncbi:MAG: signal peptidase I [Clostridia bacterium]|nr:signal peptidase I [Clostridia bacterium]
MAVVILLTFLLFGIRLFGYTPYVVLSGSMEPVYHVGSVVYVVDSDPAELKVGDPLTYRMQGGTVVTHRIIEVRNADTPESLSYITQGDANNIPDGSPVPASAVIGEPKFSIPYLGYISDFIKKPVGLMVIIGSCAAVLLISFVIESLFQKEKDEPKSSDNSETSPEKDTTEG